MGDDEPGTKANDDDGARLMKRSKKGLLGDKMSGRAAGGGQGLMATGAVPLGMGAPQYQVNRNNPTMATMTGFGGGMPFAYNTAAPSMGPMAYNKAGMPGMQYKGFGEGPPPVGGPATPPGVPGGPPTAPATPPGVPPGGGGYGGPSTGGFVPPGSTNPTDSYFGRPARPRPFNPAGPNGWTNSGQPVPQEVYGPMQPGQYSWGWGVGGKPGPEMGAKERLYISHMLGGNPSWANQVDNNNLLESIGQLSGVQFDPNSPLWQV